jgi:CheY-like chemotaxis protein
MHGHALIIDDNATNLEVMGEMLASQGFTYTLVQNPTTLPDVLVELDQIDIVFLDLEMPGIDGYDVLDMLRQEYGIAAPIVASTVHLNEIANAREMGFDGFVGKPIKVNRFPGQLQRILNGEHIWEAD